MFDFQRVHFRNVQDWTCNSRISMCWRNVTFWCMHVDFNRHVNTVYKYVWFHVGLVCPHPLLEYPIFLLLKCQISPASIHEWYCILFYPHILQALCHLSLSIKPRYTNIILLATSPKSIIIPHVPYPHKIVQYIPLSKITMQWLASPFPVGPIFGQATSFGRCSIQLANWFATPHNIL